MIWHAPAALLGLLLVSGPILVHLLLRRHAARVLFPAMRFVPVMQGAAVRLRRPSDMALLCVRAGAVAAAALAVAQPLLVTPARQRQWASRVARAVIVDTSPSVPAAAAASVADAEARGAFVSERFASADVGDAIARGAAWLQSTAAGTREIAIVSDFQRGTITAGDLARVPPHVGVRFARAGAPSSDRAPLPAVDGWRGSRWTPSLALDGAGTQVTWTRTGDGAAGAVTVRAAPSDQAAADRALAAARSFGVAVSDPPARVDIAFAGAAPTADAPPSTAWIAAAASKLATDPLVSASGAALTTGERDATLTVRTSLPATSPAAPAIVRAVLVAASPAVAGPERETTAIDDATLAGWRRAPVVDPGGVPVDASDGRWLWGIALALLLVEDGLRRGRKTLPGQETHVRAA
jgi:Aerotolerance regulator N-terminal